MTQQKPKRTRNPHAISANKRRSKVLPAKRDRRKKSREQQELKDRINE